MENWVPISSVTTVTLNPRKFLFNVKIAGDGFFGALVQNYSALDQTFQLPANSLYVIWSGTNQPVENADSGVAFFSSSFSDPILCLNAIDRPGEFTDYIENMFSYFKLDLRKYFNISQ